MSQLPPSYTPNHQTYPGNQYSQWGGNQQPNPSNGSSKKLIFILLGIIGGVFGIFFLLCVGLFTFVQSQRIDSKELKVLTANDGTSTIQVPKNWISTMLNEDASIQACNKFSECYAIVISDNKSDLEGYSIDDFAKLCASMVMDAMQEPSATTVPNPVAINGLTTRKTIIRGTVDGINVVYWITYIEGKDHFYQVMTWTLKEKASKNESILENVVNSFQEL